VDTIKLEDIKNNRNFCPLINGPCKEIALITDETKNELCEKFIEFDDERPACYFFNADDEFCEYKKFLEKGSYLVEMLAEIFQEIELRENNITKKFADFLKKNVR